MSREIGQSRWYPWLINGALLVLALVSLAPLLWMLSVSFMPQGEASHFPPPLLPSSITTHNYHELLARTGMGGNFANSLLVSLGITVGSLLLNMRSHQANNRRFVATSRDGGMTWSRPVEDAVLVEPVCQASLLRYGDKGSRLLFSNPASTKRERLTVRLSEDDGATWPRARVLHDGPAAYSCLTVLPDGTIACLYERGTKGPYEEIALARFPLDALTK